jgi:leucyl aminopeptidase
MEYKVSIDPDYASLKADCLVLGGFSDDKHWPTHLPATTRKQLANLVKSNDFNAKAGTVLRLFRVEGIAAERVLLIGCGTREQWSDKAYRRTVDTLAQHLLQGPAKHVCLDRLPLVPQRSASWHASQLARSLTASNYKYTQTKSKQKTSKNGEMKRLTVLIAGDGNKTEVQEGLRQGKAIGKGMNTAKLLGDLPANLCTPSYMARQARKLANKQANVTTRVLDEKQMDFHGMGALLSVSRGSDEAARLVAIEYQGTDKDQAPVVLVGKGVTFDSGGISLKPGAKMDEMKYDMCGAASVVGTLQAVIELGLKVNVVGLIACTENLPSGNATKPGDVITSMSGTTIEVLNTDAEGRLVLCDTLTYAARYQPSTVIDIATLTGACIVALGHHRSAVLSNHQALADALVTAGDSSGDNTWQLPLDDEYQKQLESNFADLANIGGPSAGTITAACFLARFAEDYHWAHLDIAGIAWRSGPKKGATGRPVPLLMEYLLSEHTNLR